MKRVLAGGDPRRVYTKTVDGVRRVTVCESACCGGECPIYYLAVPCPRPPPDPNPCASSPPAPGELPAYLVKADAQCNGNGGAVSPGMVVLLNGYCYTITGQKFVRLEDFAAGCIPPTGTLPSNLPSLDGPFQCVADCSFCDDRYSGFALVTRCDGGSDNPPLMFCRQELIDAGLTCIYSPGAITPGGQQMPLACRKFSLGSGTPPPNAVRVTAPTSGFDSCCSCGNDNLATANGSVCLQNGGCCCGELSRLYAYTWTIEQFIIERGFPLAGGGFYIDRGSLPAPATFQIGDFNAYIPWHREQFADGVLQYEDTITQGPYGAPVCGPYVYNFTSVFGQQPPDSAWQIACTSSRFHWRLTNDFDGSYIDVTWVWSRQAPTIGVPCAGGCNSSGSGRPLGRTVKWMGLEWYGTPYPLRVWNWLNGNGWGVDPSCGCIKPFKDVTTGLPKLLWGRRG